MSHPASRIHAATDRPAAALPRLRARFRSLTATQWSGARGLGSLTPTLRSGARGLGSLIPVRRPLARVALLIAFSPPIALSIAGCGTQTPAVPTHNRSGRIDVVGAESQYANVLSQVGGRFVSVTAIMKDPNTDPHSFEASPSIARQVGAARLVVQNGLGYDSFMSKLEAASASSSRRILDVQRLLRLPASTSNPHLWYSPRMMARVATAVAGELSALAPSHAAYFKAGAQRFRSSLSAVYAAIAAFRRAHPATPVATTEPVADYLLRAAGVRNLTPWNLQADLMNGVDPAPQDLTAQGNLLQGHRVKAIIYNRQVTDTVTQAFLQQAARQHVPQVAVYETMPGGYSYQSWMLAEVRALSRAVTTGRSTTRLG